MTGMSAGEAFAEGAWVTDTNGRRWLDFGSFGLHLLGHRHPEVVKACVDQLGRVALSTKILGNEEATVCAERLIASVDALMDGVIFANSGAEAIEIALKMVKASTGRQRVLALKKSYHGKSNAALSISDTLSGQSGNHSGSFNTTFVDPENRDAIHAALSSGSVAGVFVEPVQGEGGIIEIPPDTLFWIAKQCRTHGAIFVMDEIQTGLGRCGKVWAADHGQLQPDIVTAGKTLGGGVLPLSAVIFARRRLTTAATDPVLHASTFAASPLATRVGSTVVDLVQQEPFLDRVQQLGTVVRSGLESRIGQLKGVVDVRGHGLMIGVECASPDFAGEVVIEAAKRNLLITFCLSNPRVIRIYPPAVTSDSDVKLGLDALCESVRAAGAHLDVNSDTNKEPKNAHC
ncbi:aspartate aminotransferase family protein [Roseobacter weihaiensis]|uniref:aspartate aminotransferase family protein n=1 Tax=Roseobacter weihaiensis TaxID=2763262 RepID=UPI001D0AFBC6|nr:aspartate aminotransferase family protein [Roseobacter sp. H9]